jgi:hypothetical protein
MKKVSTAAVKATKNFSQLKLTIGLDLGDFFVRILQNFAGFCRRKAFIFFAYSGRFRTHNP